MSIATSPLGDLHIAYTKFFPLSKFKYTLRPGMFSPCLLCVLFSLVYLGHVAESKGWKRAEQKERDSEEEGVQSNLTIPCAPSPAAPPRLP